MNLVKSFKILIFSAIFLIASGYASATVVHMNSGKILQGEIVERTDEFIKIDLGFGIPLTYYLDEIQTINGQPVNQTEPVEESQDEVIEEKEIPEVEEIPEEVPVVKQPLKETIPSEITGSAKIVETPESMEEQTAATTVEKSEKKPVPTFDRFEQELKRVEKLLSEEQEPSETKETITVVTPEPPTAVEQPKVPEVQERKEIDTIITPETQKTVAPSGDTVIKENETKKIKRIEKPELTNEVATLEGIDVFKRENLSPVTIKPKEYAKAKAVVIAEPIRKPTIPRAIKKKGGNFKNIFASLAQMIREFFKKQSKAWNDVKAQFQKKLPFVKERLLAIPLKVRQGILILFSAFVAAVYVLVCFPLMLIAKKLNRKHIWLIWIPIVQLGYFVYMAKRSLWLTFLFLIPIVQIFLGIFLFVDLLKLLKKPLWLIVFLIIPILNLFTLWYLAISKIDMGEIHIL